jgi:hypothetical protein
MTNLQASRRSRNRSPDYSTLPLWQAARETDLRRLPLPARRLAVRFGLDPSTARLVASLAGIGGEGSAR